MAKKDENNEEVNDPIFPNKDEENESALIIKIKVLSNEKKFKIKKQMNQ